MGKNKFDEDNIIHRTYKKRRMIIFILFLFIISFMSVGYAALNSIFEVTGYVNLNSEVGNLEIISVEETGTHVNGTSNGTTFYISDSSTDESVILVAEFDMSFYRTMGSNASSISYNVVIKNNSLTKRKLSTVNSSPTFNSGSSTLNYEMDGISFLTTFINPGDSVTVNLTFSLNEFERYTTYSVYEVFEFEFTKVTDEDFQINASLNTTSLEFATFDDIEAISVSVSNISAYEITYVFDTSNSNFEVVDSSGNELPSFTVSAYTSSTATFYVKIADNHIFSSLSDNIPITLTTTSPSILNYNLGSVSATVPKDKVLDIIGNETINDDSSIDFTSVATSSGMYKNSASGELTYFYRGNVTNNYVSFAGYTWRIIRIDKYGTRVILDSTIGTNMAWGTNPGTGLTAENSAVKSVLNYKNSAIKTTLENWYSTNLSSYSSSIRTTLFCLDQNYQIMQSSGNGYVDVYYFGSYIRNGLDSSGYTPEFSCDSDYIAEYNIGLIAGDEVAFAGGLFNTSNTNYYLYNSSITEQWWTLSPSYYDPSLGTVGMFVVNGADGTFHDWPGTDTIEFELALRPVITLDTDKLSGGSGIPGDMYTFSS